MNLRNLLDDISKNTELLSKNNTIEGDTLYQFLPDFYKCDEFKGVKAIKIIEFPSVIINDHCYCTSTIIINEKKLNELQSSIKDKIINIYAISYKSANFNIDLTKLSDINLTEEWYDINNNEYLKFLILKIPTTLTQSEKDEIITRVDGDNELYMMELKLRNNIQFSEYLKTLHDKIDKFIIDHDKYQMLNYEKQIFLRYFIEPD